jgi:hypothetical protein
MMYYLEVGIYIYIERERQPPKNPRGGGSLENPIRHPGETYLMDGLDLT